MKAVLMIGQSNMAGRGFINEVPIISNERIQMLRNGRWQIMTEPINYDRPVAGIGLAGSFAAMWCLKNEKDAIGLIPCADGGTTLDDWAVGKTLFNHAVSQARFAMQDSELVGILWHQGESDSYGGNYQTYYEKLQVIVDSLRKELNAPEVPFVIGGLPDFLGKSAFGLECAEYELINYELQKFAFEQENCYFVTAEDLTSNPDGLHINAISQRRFGVRYYEAFSKKKHVLSPVENEMELLDMCINKPHTEREKMHIRTRVVALGKRTLRLLFPQWQGGVKPDYYFGSRLLAHIVPPSETDKVIEVPVSADFDKPIISIDGVDGGFEILQQMDSATRILEEEQPDKVIVLGGDCSVSQRPFDYLHKKYGDALGILWLDAHPDVSGTHETRHLHETVLGNLMGRFPNSAITKVEYPFSSEKVMFVGLIEDELRPIDMLVKELNMKIAVPADIMNNSQVITDWIKEKGIKSLAIHWDFDVLSREDYRSNTCARPHMTKEEYDAAMGELSVSQVGRILKDVSEQAEIVGLVLAEHIPWDAIHLRTTLEGLSIFK